MSPTHKVSLTAPMASVKVRWVLRYQAAAYSPDLNPIEMAFSKLKVLIRRAAARTYDDLWKAVGHVCNLFTEEECYNFFAAAGYETD